jgi:hypothetical protein
MPEDPPTRVRNVGGRPRVPAAERLVRTYVSLRPATYDAFARKALALNVSITRLLRQELERGRR